MPRLTQTGWLFFAVLMAFSFAALTSQSGLLLLLVGILLALFLINFSKARRALAWIEVMPPGSGHLAEGERLSEPWLVHNDGPQPVGQIEIGNRLGTLLRIGQLSGKASARLIPQLAPARRGVYAHGETWLTTSFPFGLVSCRRTISLPGEIVVCPAVYETASPLAAGYDTMVGGKHRGTRRSTSGTHFAGVRPLQPGDPFKQIHWPSSAKGQGLMVKTYDEELAGRVAVIIDPGACGDLKTADDAVRAAGSLVLAALNEGHHVEWLELGADTARLVPPFDDGHDFLDALARLPLRPGLLHAAALESALGEVSAKCAVALVLTTVNAEVRQFVADVVRRSRSVAVYLPATQECIELNSADYCYHERGISRHSPAATAPETSLAQNSDLPTS